MSTTTKARANWRTPDAVRVDVDEHADRLAWLKERRAGIGGTDAAVLMGMHVSLTMSTVADVTPAHVFLSKTATDEPVEDDKNIFAFGHAMEPALIARVEDRYGLTVRPGGFYRHKADEWRYANPDGLASDGGLVECKTASHRSKAGAKWLAGDLSEHAWAQSQHYLAVTGRTHTYYSVGIRDDTTGWESVPRHLWGEPWFAEMAVREWVQVGPIPRDEDFISALIEREREFWGYVVAGDLPESLAAGIPAAERWPVAVPDFEVAAAIPDMTLDDLARLGIIKTEQAKLAEERAAIEGRIKSEIGRGEFLTAGGHRVARWQTVSKSDFDKKSFGMEYPDLLEQFTRRGTARRLTILGSAE
ncbi:YqaJ viral recombinase family protein [Nocardioides sp.]|uniref:YqaJ viral recombinase family nuclease n=1 Tax=Nocardioides sp. TaxID=35761 RepID=UPI0039E40E02